MIYILSLFLLPPLLIFGIYHLALWFNLAGIAARVFWRRVALSSAIAHAFLAAGFFTFCYLDYRANGAVIAPGRDFQAFLFEYSEFWQIMFFFDLGPMIVLLGFFGALDSLGVGFRSVVPVTIVIVALVGTLQWYWVGGAVGAALERLWSGLKTEDDDLPDWLG